MSIFFSQMYYITTSFTVYFVLLSGTNREIEDEPSKQFSAGFLVAVAVSCSVVTAVIIILGLFVFRRLSSNKTGKCDYFLFLKML